MNIVIIHKEPIIERIPNLKTFIVYSSLHNHKVTLITTQSNIFPEPTFINKNIKYLAVKERSRKLQIPTIIPFYTLCFYVLICNFFRNYSLILAGKYGLVFGALIKIIHLKKFCSFIIEYPVLDKCDKQKLKLSDKLELKGIRLSKFLVTHDKLHAEFIATKLKIRNIKFVTIPNGTIGLAKKNESTFLHGRLNIKKENKIVLHSGGFGIWFESKELAKESERIPDEYVMVFHISHNIKNDKYYNEYIKHKESNDRTLFSMEPVPTDKLDELISSAYIGIAWYSTSELKYRATMLGLAAGKIGNYLKCGIPVIVPNYDSLSYISEFSCGKQISDLKSLSIALSDIEKNYSWYSDNALRCYNELWNTENYCQHLLDELNTI